MPSMERYDDCDDDTVVFVVVVDFVDGCGIWRVAWYKREDCGPRVMRGNWSR